MIRKIRFYALFLLFLTVTLTCGRQAEASVPSFGRGPVEVRFYTDYFCPPCQATEPVLEPIFQELIERKAIRLTIIDTPFNRGTILLARYYLFATRGVTDLAAAFRVRKILLTAAQRALTQPEQIEALLKEEKVPFKSFDVKPILDGYNALFREDRISATPTAVIIEQGVKRVLVGGNEIVRALRALP
jgi:thiol:disulfide interchange protein DsbA